MPFNSYQSTKTCSISHRVLGVCGEPTTLPSSTFVVLQARYLAGPKNVKDIPLPHVSKIAKCFIFLNQVKFFGHFSWWRGGDAAQTENSLHQHSTIRIRKRISFQQVPVQVGQRKYFIVKYLNCRLISDREESR